MGICQSRPKGGEPSSAEKSIYSGSGASATTVAISNRKKSQPVVGRKEDWKLDKIGEGEPATTLAESPVEQFPHSTPSRRRSRNPLERLSPRTSRSAEARRQDPDGFTSTPATQNSEVEPRRLWFSSSQPKEVHEYEPDADGDDDDDLEELIPESFENTDATAETFTDGSVENNGKRSANNKRQQMGFSPIRTTIPEETDPEMPSDEEDFRDDLKRSLAPAPPLKEEPGRLLPVKLRSQPTTSVSSVTSPTAEKLVGLDPGDRSSVNARALSDFQRLKLQVKLQKHQEIKDRRVTKVEDKVNDAEAHKKLWLDYQQVKQDATEMEQDTDLTKARALSRSNSFDLKDSTSWYFDFQQDHIQILPDEGDDDASKGNGSLLSEQSMDAQRRYYAEKRRMRKEKKKQSKLDKKMQKDGPPGQLVRTDSGVLSMGDGSRLNMNNSVSSGFRDYGPSRPTTANNSVNSGISRDYGPAREIPAPLQLEISLPNTDGYASDLNDNRDDAGSYVGSYVSDLGDESYGGWGGSQGGYSYGGASNDYGVKRRIRRSDYSGQYGSKERESIQSKLSALEQAVARFQKEAEEEEEEETPRIGSLSISGDAHEVKPVPALSSKALTALPLEQLVDRFERAQASPQRDENVDEYNILPAQGGFDATTLVKPASSRNHLFAHENNHITNASGDTKGQQTQPAPITPTLSNRGAVESTPTARDPITSDPAYLHTAVTPETTYNYDDDDESAATGPLPIPIERATTSFRSSAPIPIEEEKKDSDFDSAKESAISSTLSQRAKISSLLKARRSSRPAAYETPPATERTTTNFWKQDLDDLLLKNIIPERTNATPDESVPENKVSGASFWTTDLFNFIPERANMTPDESQDTPYMKRPLITPGTSVTTCTTPPMGEEEYHDSVEESPEEVLAKRITKRSQQETPYQQPDPEGSYIDTSESLRLAGEVEAQVTQVLTNFRS